MIAVVFSQSFALKSFKSFTKLHDYGLHNTQRTISKNNITGIDRWVGGRLAKWLES